MSKPVPYRSGLVASFADAELYRSAVRVFTAAGWPWQIYTPFPDEELTREVRPARESVHNPVRFWTLFGGLCGTTAAFSMTIWMSSNWPLVVGGKPIVSWPPFICVAFEMTVLLGSLSCMTGLFVHGGLPQLLTPAAFQPQFLRDRFGLFLACDAAEEPSLRQRLLAAGAVDVWTACNTPRGRLELTDPMYQEPGT